MSDDEGDECCAPPNFSWVVKNQLAAMGWPCSTANLRFIACQGIKHLITLSPERRPPIENCRELLWTEIPVKEFQSPTLEQINQFIGICECHFQKNEAVGVHCRQGKGRTGTMVACYLVRFHGLPPDRAIINLRMQRPGSIETPEQERVVHQYHDYLRSN